MYRFPRVDLCTPRDAAVMLFFWIFLNFYDLIPRPHPCRKSTSTTSCSRFLCPPFDKLVGVVNPLHTFVSTPWSPFSSTLLIRMKLRSRKLRLGEVGTRDDNCNESEESKNRFPHLNVDFN